MLYLLKRIEQPRYGDDVGFVVRACTTEDARRFVHGKLLDEELARINDSCKLTLAGGQRPPHLLEMDRNNARNGLVLWLDPNQSTCVGLPPDGPEEIILSDHLNG